MTQAVDIFPEFLDRRRKGPKSTQPKGYTDPKDPATWQRVKGMSQHVAHTQVKIAQSVAQRAAPDVKAFVEQLGDATVWPPYVVECSGMFFVIPWHDNVMRAIVLRDHTRRDTLPVVVVDTVTNTDDLKARMDKNLKRYAPKRTMPEVVPPVEPHEREALIKKARQIEMDISHIPMRPVREEC